MLLIHFSLLSCKDTLEIKEVVEVSHAIFLKKNVESDQQPNLGDSANQFWLKNFSVKGCMSCFPIREGIKNATPFAQAILPRV
jgi:hypothetical protein